MRRVHRSTTILLGARLALAACLLSFPGLRADAAPFESEEMGKPIEDSPAPQFVEAVAPLPAPLWTVPAGVSLLAAGPALSQAVLLPAAAVNAVSFPAAGMAPDALRARMPRALSFEGGKSRPRNQPAVAPARAPRKAAQDLEADAVEAAALSQGSPHGPAHDHNASELGFDTPEQRDDEPMTVESLLHGDARPLNGGTVLDPDAARAMGAGRLRRLQEQGLVATLGDHYLYSTINQPGSAWQELPEDLRAQAKEAWNSFNQALDARRQNHVLLLGVMAIGGFDKIRDRLAADAALPGAAVFALRPEVEAVYWNAVFELGRSVAEQTIANGGKHAREAKLAKAALAGFYFNGLVATRSFSRKDLRRLAWLRARMENSLPFLRKEGFLGPFAPEEGPVAILKARLIPEHATRLQRYRAKNEPGYERPIPADKILYKDEHGQDLAVPNPYDPRRRNGKGNLN